MVESDETGAWVAGQNGWQWIFKTAKATYHVIAAIRGPHGIAEVTGEAVPLTWVSDLWSTQLKAPGKQYQIWHAYQLRDLQYEIDTDRSAWADRLQQFCGACNAW